MQTKDWKSLETATALVIGHDPRLQKSDTVAQYALFADYIFNPKPIKPSEKKKYELAKATFDQIRGLTNNQINPNTVYVTNLCNNSLTHAPVGKTVLIDEIEAKEGYQNILQILHDNPTIEYVFPMSLQVNYWLQKLGLYNSNNDFVRYSEPKEIGLKNDLPYFQPLRQGTFTLICGNVYEVINGHQKVIPILHSKNYPLNGKFLVAYGSSYDRIRKLFHK
jgi:hypothetical protein